MSTSNKEMFDLMSKYISKSDVYAASAIAKISMSIFSYRKNLKLSQKEFAKLMGVSQGMVSKWESAEYNFTIENIAQIAEKMHMTFNLDFIPESDYFANRFENEYDVPSKKLTHEKTPLTVVSTASAAA